MQVEPGSQPTPDDDVIKMNDVILIYTVIILCATAVTVGNVFLKIYDFQKTSIVLQPFIIVVTVAW
jgi:hypothetical protein